MSKTQKDGYKCIRLFDLTEQLKMGLQNENDVNKKRSRLAAASSVDDSTKHNDTVGARIFVQKHKCKRRSQFHKLLHQSFIACFKVELFQRETYNIEILYVLIIHRIL